MITFFFYTCGSWVESSSFLDRRDSARSNRHKLSKIIGILGKALKGIKKKPISRKKKIVFLVRSV